MHVHYNLYSLLQQQQIMMLTLALHATYSIKIIIFFYNYSYYFLLHCFAWILQNLKASHTKDQTQLLTIAK